MSTTFDALNDDGLWRHLPRAEAGQSADVIFDAEAAAEAAWVAEQRELGAAQVRRLATEARERGNRQESHPRAVLGTPTGGAE